MVDLLFHGLLAFPARLIADRNGRRRAFFLPEGSLKREWTANRFCATRQDARDDVVDYIERFCNRRRKHSYPGYLSPTE
jgi:transposase InsO family protein